VNGYEILEHPSDMGFRVHAGSFEDLLAAAGEALASIVLDCSEARPLETIEIAVQGEDREALVVNFLSEVLYVLDGRRLAVSRVVVTAAGPHGVSAALLGEPRDDQRHPSRHGVKAVTYHQLSVRQSPAGWTAEVYLDI
jgi:SHS2 domain-containing protein